MECRQYSDTVYRNGRTGTSVLDGLPNCYYWLFFVNCNLYLFNLKTY